MIHIVYENEHAKNSKLFNSMYEHRAVQFGKRLNWQVKIDDLGRERDEYDDLNPMYLILERDGGDHAGSMRFLPTTEETMINTYFTNLTGGVTIKSPFIWECTRFCLAPNAGTNDSWKVLLGTVELGLHFNLQFFVGVFDHQMLRVYKRIGWDPTIIGEGLLDGKRVCAGLWPISEAVRTTLIGRQDIMELSSQPPLRISESARMKSESKRAEGVI